MIRRDDPSVYPIVCSVCLGAEFDHDRVRGRCLALTPLEYERVAITLASGKAPAVRRAA